MKKTKIKSNLKNDGTHRERITLSFSFSKYEELKMFTIIQNGYEIKVNQHMKLKSSLLCKYLIQKGLEDLDQKFGQINQILKQEKLIEDEN